MSFRFDSYTLFARVAPSVVVVSPLLVFAALAGVIDPANIVAGLLLSVACVVGSQLARDAGKRLEKEMWEGWGGAPTLRRLRFGGGDPPERIAERHQQLERVLGRNLPGQREQERDPARVDRAYEDAVVDLRDETRDRSRFGLLFNENVDYGFRRNLLGLRPWGLAACALALVASLAVALLGDGSSREILIGAGVPGIAAILIGAFFVLVVDDGWVRVPAEAYADRLFGALGVLDRGLAKDQ